MFPSDELLTVKLAQLEKLLLVWTEQTDIKGPV